MLQRSQFSLKWLLLEIFWVAVSLSSFRASTILANEYRDADLTLFFAGVAAGGAALGGLFGNMTMGAIWAFVVAAVARVVTLPIRP